MSDVIGASFPHVDRRRRADALVQSCTMVSIIMFPLAIGLAAVAPTVVDTFFDAKWSNVGAMLMTLSALSIARPLASILASYFYATRRPSVVLWLEWGSLAGIIAAITTLGRIDVNWACALVGIVFVLRTLAGMWIVGCEDGVMLSEFLVPMARPFAVCLLMAAGVSVARLGLSGLPAATRLLVEVSVGAAIYIGGAPILARASCDELLRAVRSALERSR
jgi:PST family polysaccharide transporter